ncbi:hypothetical protein EDB81DRAFT_844945 [Dactylonectria macrodidyma]|uniref:Secreted protein n=1 Tax=Dactylonectria macrodidyma TaxID=307937 RepID=A0A9P9IUV9_9HYPO|nr:hypothetical protein EDB81DRAFT_844945 [Dactylonectria macrodidyma]
MKLAYAALVISLLFQSCLFTLIDITQHEPIAPKELKARLGTTPAEYNPDKRHDGMVYFCREVNWGPPCFVYYPKLNYTCSQLGPNLAGYIGSVFVEPGVICRLSKCAPFKLFAWPETQNGWSNLFHQNVPGGGIIGYATTHFTCAQCTACIRD